VNIRIRGRILKRSQSDSGWRQSAGGWYRFDSPPIRQWIWKTKERLVTSCSACSWWRWHIVDYVKKWWAMSLSTTGWERNRAGGTQATGRLYRSIVSQMWTCTKRWASKWISWQSCAITPLKCGLLFQEICVGNKMRCSNLAKTCFRIKLDNSVYLTRTGLKRWFVSDEWSARTFS